MKHNFPHTPFATSISRSAREAELRLKNILSGPKKRPPVLFLFVIFSACLLCGNLVSCQVVEAETPDVSQQEPAQSKGDEKDTVPDSEDRTRVYELESQDAPGHTLTFVGQLVDQEWHPQEIYGPIQIFDGDTLIQTITKDSPVQDEGFLFDGFLPWVEPDYRDVNFDGVPDLGLLCGSTYNGPVYWYLWDREEQQFVPGFYSSLKLDVDNEKQILLDFWRDGLMGWDCWTYQFNDQGERVPLEHRQIDWDDLETGKDQADDAQGEIGKTIWDGEINDDSLDRREVLKSKDGDDWSWSDKWDAKEAEWEKAQMEEYNAVGVTRDGKNYYYQGQLVNIFLDIRPNKSVYTLDLNPAGTVNVKILRDANNKITGAAYMTETEAAELLEDMRE